MFKQDRYLILETQGMGLRDAVHGWDYQDLALIRADKEIGLSACWSRSEYDPRPEYSCVAFALADGWELLGPPVPTPIETCDWEIQPELTTYYTWYLIKRQNQMSRDL